MGFAKAGHDRLAVFGAGKDHKKEEWRSMIRQLVAAGFLRLDVKGYGGLAVTSKGRALVAGQESFDYRRDAMRPAPSARRRGQGTEPVAELIGAETVLFARLKELRLHLAKERGVPAYVVFSDKTLADMARRCPKNVAEFGEVNGVGAAKLKKFATPFLEAIAATTAAETPAGGA